MVYIIPRLKSNMKRAANRRFKERKLGPAKIVGKLSESKIKVEFKGMKIIAYGWEATKIKDA
jgi:hypothetical protein